MDVLAMEQGAVGGSVQLESAGGCANGKGGVARSRGPQPGQRGDGLGRTDGGEEAGCLARGPGAQEDHALAQGNGDVQSVGEAKGK